ncbi:hypothetical protein BASA60_001901 [Batrachochytrium salamandrivorans]|nr:hypothetical protein BASA60_001901 [Batrachochytrium salamandrivorans]
MKFNVLVVAAMVISSVNAGGKGRFRNPFKKSGGGSMSEQSYNPLEAGEGALQESDPNETEPTCDDLEAKLRHLYDNIRSRNAIVC